jgi:hypothetical protein
MSDVQRYSRASKETGIGKGKYAQAKSIDAPKNRRRRCVSKMDGGRAGRA